MRVTLRSLDSRPVAGRPKDEITIGQLADYAGVTIKAIRHYHQRGLLEEPARDASGYRRYNARHAIALVKIKTLADAGVPLARIKELLVADPGDFAAAISEIDRTLQRRAEQLLRTRERIAHLNAGDRLFVSTDVADYLDQLHELGVSERSVRMERDLWILMQSVSPRQAAMWIAEKLEAIRDPEFRAICLECDAAFGWLPDDPRLIELAERAARWLAAWRAEGGSAALSAKDEAAARLSATGVSVGSPAWDRLAALARGSPRRTTSRPAQRRTTSRRGEDVR